MTDISCFQKFGKISQNLSSAAVIIWRFKGYNQMGWAHNTIYNPINAHAPYDKRTLKYFIGCLLYMNF